MSILNVNTIQPVGSGQTITVSATNISAPSTVVTASSFVGNVTATTISGVSTASITTAYITQLAGGGAGTSIQIPSGSKLVGVNTGSVTYPGAILQVVQTVKGDTFSVAPGANTFGTVTGLSASITPTSASSKILVTLDMYVGCSGYQVGIRLYRDGTFIGGGTPEGSRTATTWYHNPYNSSPVAQTYTCIRAGGMYLDSPASTSALSYTIGIKDYASYTAYVNRSNQYQNASDYDHNGISTITLMEVSA